MPPKKSDVNCLLKIKVTPKAAKSAIIGWEEDTLRIRIAAVPEKGAANKAIIAFLADILDVAKSRIHLVKGDTAREKLLKIEGITLSDVKHKIM